MKKLLLSLSLLALATGASAFYKYDAKSGNSYSTIGNTTYGSNARNGTTWSSTTNGSRSYGTDSRGNTWNYYHNTGYYNNSNGTTCYGKGNLRTCN